MTRALTLFIAAIAIISFATSARATWVEDVTPGSLFLLTATRSSGSSVELEWSSRGLNAPGFKEYEVYRGLSSEFPTDAGHFLTSAPEPRAVDDNADLGTTYYYKVVAVDIHDNRSEDSDDAMVDDVAAGAVTPALLTLQVFPNSPNPFSDSTEIRFSLSAAADVSLAVYDLTGHRVYHASMANIAAGAHRVGFGGYDANGVALPGGAYFYRVTAAGITATTKMIIQR